MTTSIQEIDEILPQMQCGLCGFQGCKPYAEALQTKEAAINLCPPGGIEGLIALAQLLDTDPQPYMAEMQGKAKTPSVAVIREAECIGCTKCIQACPVDAILGSAKNMHTVIADECTGCELCIAPCPVDCIDMISVTKPTVSKSHHYRERYQARQQRFAEENTKPQTIATDKKAFLEAALARAKAKKPEANIV